MREPQEPGTHEKPSCLGLGQHETPPHPNRGDGVPNCKSRAKIESEWSAVRSPKRPVSGVKNLNIAMDETECVDSREKRDDRDNHFDRPMWMGQSMFRIQIRSP